MPKDKEGHPGRWVTVHGTHIFIRDGETFEQSMARQFDTESWEDAEYRDRLYDTLTASFTYADIRQGQIYERYPDGTEKRIKPKQWALMRLKRIIDARSAVRTDVDDIIVGCISTSIREFIIKDEGSSFYKVMDDRINVNIFDYTTTISLNTLGHEIGHAIDATIRGSNFRYSKYDMNMNQMLAEESPDIMEYKNEVDRLNQLYNEYYKAKEVEKYSAVCEAIDAIIDTAQAVFGDTQCKRVMGKLGHEEGYFKSEGIGRAGELYAELMGERFSSSIHPLYDFFKKHCPKTIEIFEDSIERAKQKWNSKH